MSRQVQRPADVQNRNGRAVPEFLRVVIADEEPATARAVAEKAVLALNSSMMRLYDESLETFKRNMRDRVPIILALFTGQGGQMILYRPGHAPECLVGKSRRSSDSSSSDASRANVLVELQSEDTFPDSL
jgi:hypothetical protein